MTIELTKYVTEEKLILVVSEILSVYFDHKEERCIGSSLDKEQYEVIIETNRRTYKLWYNGRKELALATYNQVKTALESFYTKDTTKDTIKDELKKYLQSCSQAE